MHRPISFAKGLDEETKFSFLNLAITKAIGKIPPVAKSRIYIEIFALNCVLRNPTKPQIMVPATGIEIDLFEDCSNSILYSSNVKILSPCLSNAPTN